MAQLVERRFGRVSCETAQVRAATYPVLVITTISFEPYEFTLVICLVVLRTEINTGYYYQHPCKLIQQTPYSNTNGLLLYFA